MPLPPGKTNNPNGRPTGSVNKATADLRQRISAFIADKWESIETDFAALEPKDRLNFIEKLMGYAVPKLQSVEYVPDTDRLLDGLSDEQLDLLLSQLNQRLNDEPQPTSQN